MQKIFTRQPAIDSTNSSDPTTSDLMTSATPKLDPYPYGWRDVRTVLANGKLVWTRLPLTLEDVLHPQEEDVLMPTDEHERFRTYLFDVLRYLVKDDPQAIVLSDTNVAWDVPAIKPHRPDIAVIFNVREPKVWSTFNVSEEGTRPALIIEITSLKTRHLDLETKLDEYELVDVPLYVIVDIHRRRRSVHYQLLGWQLTPDGYAPLPLDEQGRLWLEPVRAWLALHNGRLTCWREDEQTLQDYVDLATSLEEAEARAQAEAAARAALEARLQALEAEIRRRQNQ